MNLLQMYSHKANDSIDLGKRFARAQFPFIIGNKNNRRRAFFQIKNSLSFPELCQAVDFVDRNVHASLKELLFGVALPDDYSKLGESDVLPVADNLINEINWVLIAIRKHAYHINLFLVYKEAYENNFLLGNYIEAEKYLGKIETEICYSLWTLENRFLIKEHFQSSSDNKEFLNYFNSVNNAEGTTKSLAHFLSMRAEKTLSVNRFNADLELGLSKLQTHKKQENTDYYLFKLSFLNNLNFSKFKEIVAYDFQHSVVDKYLNLRKVLIHLLTAANSMVDKIEEGKTIKAYIINRINYLNKKIDDPILYKLKLFANDKVFPAFDEIESAEQIGIIDKYTTGLYQDVEEDLRRLLLVKCTQFDLYELYVKSLVYQKKQFFPVGNSKSLQNQILSEMYKIVSVSTNPVETGINLLRMANNISSNILSYGIIDFVFHQTRGKEERKLMSRLSFNVANPIINEIYPDSESQIFYLNFLKEKFPTSISIDFLLGKALGAESLLKFESTLPEVKFKTELAKDLQKRRQFKDASKIWEYLISSHRATIPVLETAIRNLFICYEEMKGFDECIKLYVDNFFENSYIVKKIEVHTLLQKIKENRFKVVKPVIELPIFYTISNADENEMHTAFEKFNLSFGVLKPSQLLKRFDEFEKEKILFYLKFTCGPEILKHSIHIIGSKDRLEERLAICQFLREIDIDDKPFYDDEIKYISNILVIQKGLLELDESKIYVNEQGIISNELREYEPIFQRFKVIAGIADKNPVLLLNAKSGRLTTLNYSDEGLEAEKIEYSTNPVYDIYKELFDAIKDKFLHSKFGIVAYLSTRIRHGVLLGEIRPIFEKHKLITLKEGDTANYRRNVYWDNVYNDEEPIVIAKVQDQLREFSYCIDGLIFDLIKKYLQVYNEETNKDGWFDYDFTDDDLFWFSIRSIKSRDFNQFSQQVFELLWDRTDKNLSLIREKIQNDISTSFNDLFDRLEKNILEILGVSKSEPLINAIKACSTEALSAITRISSWFKRSGTSASDFKLENLVDIVMEYTNKTFPNRRIDLQRQIEFDQSIKGEFLTHFADLLRIFTENILKHADDKEISIPSKIVSQYVDNKFLYIRIENVITDKEKLEVLKSVWTNQTIDIAKLSSEGKSGYHKAYKILKSDLKDEHNTLTTYINEAEDTFGVTMLINCNEIIK